MNLEIISWNKKTVLKDKITSYVKRFLVFFVIL